MNHDEELEERQRQKAVAENDSVGRCLWEDCDAEVVRIERYKAEVVWKKQEDGSWECRARDTGTHFHLFCSEYHETRCWANPDAYADGVLPKALQSVVYPAAPYLGRFDVGNLERGW